MPVQATTILDDHPEVTLSLLERPLTPISKCLGTEVPVQCRRTAAGPFSEKTLHSYHFGPAILAHAKVYTFAHLHLMYELERLALQHLIQVLTLVDCKRNRLTPYLEEAIRHVYEHTLPRNFQEEPGRKLLSQFVAIHYTDLLSAELKNLALEGGDFMADLSHKVGRQLQSSMDCRKSLEQEIDGLEKKVKTWQARCADKENEIRKMQQELQEWESWSRTVPNRRRRKTRLSSWDGTPDETVEVSDQYGQRIISY